MYANYKVRHKIIMNCVQLNIEVALTTDCSVRNTKITHDSILENTEVLIAFQDLESGIATFIDKAGGKILYCVRLSLLVGALIVKTLLL